MSTGVDAGMGTGVDRAVVGAGIEEKHGHRRIVREACGSHSTTGTCADHNVVEALHVLSMCMLVLLYMYP